MIQRMTKCVTVSAKRLQNNGEQCQRATERADWRGNKRTSQLFPFRTIDLKIDLSTLVVLECVCESVNVLALNKQAEPKSMSHCQRATNGRCRAVRQVLPKACR